MAFVCGGAVSAILPTICQVPSEGRHNANYNRFLMKRKTYTLSITRIKYYGKYYESDDASSLAASLAEPSNRRKADPSTHNPQNVYTNPRSIIPVNSLGLPNPENQH